MNQLDLKLKSVAYRRTVLRIIKASGAGHTAGSLSCTDILNVLYNHVLHVDAANFLDPNRDRYIHSKGHSVEALYTVLADKGFFPESDLEGFGKFGTPYIGHPTRKVNGIEQNTGALGHGLSVSVGLAIAGKKNNRPYRVFTLLGDGELTEGSNWEASLTAAHYRLDNLIVVVDRNTLQITGRTEEVSALEPLESKFSAFGYSVRTCDGNSIDELVGTLSDLPFQAGKPSLVLARTIKGKGVSFMEDNVKWHHKVPSDDEYRRAVDELDRAEALLREEKAMIDGAW